jgi:hypothetical protein
MERGVIVKIFNENIKNTNFKIVGSNIPEHLNIIFPEYSQYMIIASDNQNDSFENEGAKNIFINGLC